MEADDRGLRSGAEAARIENLLKETGRRKAAVEEEGGFERECFGREMGGERVVEEVKSCRDCAIMRGISNLEKEMGIEKMEMVIKAERGTEIPKVYELFWC